jgi:hypothetical protein
MSISVLSHEFVPDGFLIVSNSNYKINNNGIFVYCDKPDVYKKKCEDILIRGNGSIESDVVEGKWREGDEYIKYKLNSTFIYVDLEEANRGVILKYRKIKQIP